YPAGQGPSDLTIGDLDGDGDLDLAIASADSSVLLNKAGFSVPPVSHSLGLGAANLVSTSDLNNDGILDLAVVARGQLTTLFNQGNAVFKDNAVASDIAGGCLAIADIDGDNNADLVLGTSANIPQHSSGSVLVFWGQGAGAFASPVSYDIGGLPVSLTIGDY